MQSQARVTATIILAALLWLAPVAHSFAGTVDLPDEKWALDKAGSLINLTVAELTEQSRKTLLDTWQGATAKSTMLIWGFSETSASLLPVYWLTEVVKDGKRIGLLALAPREGTLVWRATRLTPTQAEMADRVFAKKTSEIGPWAKGKIEAKEAELFDFDHSVTVSINGAYYWFIPARGERLVASICYPAGGKGKRQEIWQAVSAGRSAVPARMMPAFSGDPFDLRPNKNDGGRLAGEAWMVGEVPLYAAPGSGGGWAHALSMVRQWWSPVVLGQREAQEKVWRHYAGLKKGEGLPLFRVYEMTRNAEAVDARWDAQKGENDYIFEPFRTLWFGPGKPFMAAPDGTTWKSDDPRAWITREAPVILAIDADGLGHEDPADQYVVATGYSTAHKHIYVNNPYGLGDTWSYAAFDKRYWASWYGVQCEKPKTCDKPTYYRHGMVVGLPGDLTGPPAPVPVGAIPGATTDAAVVTISNLGLLLGAPNVKAFAGKDAFGQKYQTTCKLDVPTAEFIGGKQGGSWSELVEKTGKKSFSVLARLNKVLTAGAMVGGGSFKAAFTASGSTSEAEVSMTCTVFDANDRTHTNAKQQIKVFDDAKESNGKKQMRRPDLRSRSAARTFKIAVRDDDPAPPEITVLSPDVVYDDHKGAFRFKVRVEDASGLDKTGIKWAFEDKAPKSFGSFTANAKSEYWLDIPREKWIDHVGETMHLWVMARDRDDDRKGDQSSAEKTFTVRIEDDDPVGPQVVQYVARRAENMQFEVMVNLADQSGLHADQSWPKLYYSFKGMVGPDNFNGIAKMVEVPSYGEGWYKAVAPWGEQGALAYAASKEQKEDTFIYIKVRCYDRDNDRENDDAESWSEAWAEVYLPTPLTDTTTIVDIWPAGDRETGVNSLWDNWFDPPPTYVPSNLFFEGQPASVNPPPVPEVLTGPDAKIRIHINVSLAFVQGGAHLAITGGSLSLAKYKLNAGIVSKKGVWDLGTMAFPSEEEDGAVEAKLAVPSGALSTGENILVLTPAEGTGDYDQLAIQRIHLEANELPKPPKIEGYGVE
jgi:hypothetical protein